MVGIEEILARLQEAARNPLLAAQEAKAQGKKAVGCVPYFAPMELVHAAGMHPVELWGGGSITGAAGSYYPAFYCSLLFTLMERALDGTYDDLDAVIVPTTCDGLRNLEENWKFARPEANIIDFVQPMARTTRESHDYLTWQVRQVATRLEEISGARITERALRASIAAYNEQRAAMRRFSEVAAQHVDIITPQLRQAVYASARSLPVEEHTQLVSRLNDLLESRPVYETPHLKVVLTGILVDSLPLLEELERNGIVVVGDLTVAESARYAADVPGRIDPFESLAQAWADVQGVSVALDPKKLRGPMIANLVRERGADGVIDCVVKFCEEEEFDVPVLQQQMAAEHIPLLVLEVESQDVASEQASTRIQAFAEMLDMVR